MTNARIPRHDDDDDGRYRNGRKGDEMAGSPSTLDLPLSGLRVLDFARGALAGIARQLAELGADVIRIEPPGGAPDRREGAAANEVSVAFAAANLGKRALALELHRDEDRKRLEALVGETDLLIESFAPGSADALALDVAGLRRRHPQLVALSVTPFGQSGAYAQWQATGPVLHGLSAELSRSGLPGRAPLLPPGDLAIECATAQAVFALLLAYCNRLRTGIGDTLDLSLLDASTQALDPGYGIAGSAAMGVPASKLPRNRENAAIRYPIFPCADGYVRICILAPRQWQGMFEWLGRPEEFADPSFNHLFTRFKSKTLGPAIARRFAQETRAQLEAAGQKFGVPTAGVLSLTEALESEQMQARKAFRSVEFADGTSAPFPDGVMEIDGLRAGIRGGVPPLENEVVFAPRDEMLSPFTAPGAAPLAGVRVLDLGVIVVGAEQARLFADQGAEVYKVETSAFPDGSRQTRDGAAMSPSMAAGHRNKLGLGLNLRHAQGKAMFLQLVRDTDIVFSNFKPGTMESLGLGYETLSRVNPRIIVVESSAFGPTGPWAGRMGYGPLVRASTGLSMQWRYADDPMSFSDAITVYPDHVAGRISAIGALALMLRRARTGRGGTVSISQAEVMLGHLAAQIAGHALAGSRVSVDESDAPRAPWGVFPCAGDDEWCVITVRDDADWQRFCGVLGDADWSDDAGLSTAAGRAAARARVDARVAAWTRTLAPQQVMHRLQSAGVPAAAMLRVSELPEFDYFRERGFFTLARHPKLDEPFHVEKGPVVSQRLADPPNAPAPLIGEHSVQIAQQRLGLTEEQVRQLIADGVLEWPGG